MCDRMCSAKRAGRLNAFPHPSYGQNLFLGRNGAGDRGVSGVNGVFVVCCSSSSDSESKAASGDSNLDFLFGGGSSTSKPRFAAILLAGSLHRDCRLLLNP